MLRYHRYFPTRTRARRLRHEPVLVALLVEPRERRPDLPARFLHPEREQPHLFVFGQPAARDARYPPHRFHPTGAPACTHPRTRRAAPPSPPPRPRPTRAGPPRPRRPPRSASTHAGRLAVPHTCATAGRPPSRRRPRAVTPRVAGARRGPPPRPKCALPAQALQSTARVRPRVGSGTAASNTEPRFSRDGPANHRAKWRPRATIRPPPPDSGPDPTGLVRTRPFSSRRGTAPSDRWRRRSRRLHRRRKAGSAGRISTDVRPWGGVFAAFCHSIHRAIPGRSHPTSFTALVAPSSRGFRSGRREASRTPRQAKVVGFHLADERRGLVDARR